ncbi:MAG: YafY family protein [Reyranella sp.]|nr:YafY family protein [Reyranella sp.]
MKKAYEMGLMRRSDRLFDIIQRLRTASGPVTAAALAADLEVTSRTVYRDIATLQARRVPIEGAAGIGYVLRKGFDLPPLMFTIDEVEAIAVGARLVRRLRDPKLQESAEAVLAKVTVVLPERLRSHLSATPIYVSPGITAEVQGADLADVRAAIRDSRKLYIAYADEKGRRTNRTIWPIAMAYYIDVTLVGAWCELRADYRNFRVERIRSSRVLDEHFDQDGGRLFAEWSALPKERPDALAVPPNSR